MANVVENSLTPACYYNHFVEPIQQMIILLGQVKQKWDIRFNFFNLICSAFCEILLLKIVKCGHFQQNVLYL